VSPRNFSTMTVALRTRRIFSGVTFAITRAARPAPERNPVEEADSGSRGRGRACGRRPSWTAQAAPGSCMPKAFFGSMPSCSKDCCAALDSPPPSRRRPSGSSPASGGTLAPLLSTSPRENVLVECLGDGFPLLLGSVNPFRALRSRPSGRDDLDGNALSRQREGPAPASPHLPHESVLDEIQS
jgi:hypothetical protein